MSKVIIFGAQSSEKPFSASTSMFNFLTEHGNARYELKYYEDVVFRITENSVDVCIVNDDGSLTDLRTVNTVFLRNIVNEAVRAAIARYCDFHGVRVVNSENIAIPLTTKLSQYVVAAQNGILTPRTFYCSNLHKHINVARSFFSNHSGQFVIKSITGSNGNDNHKIADLDSPILSSMKDGIIQSFIPNSFEYRVIVVNGRASMVYKKINTGKSYQNNIAKGGKRELIDELPAEASKVAVDIARLSNREIAGVDVVYDQQEKNYKLFEINFSYGHPDFDAQSQSMGTYGNDLVNFFEQEERL